MISHRIIKKTLTALLCGSLVLPSGSVMISAEDNMTFVQGEMDFSAEGAVVTDDIDRIPEAEDSEAAPAIDAPLANQEETGGFVGDETAAVSGDPLELEPVNADASLSEELPAQTIEIPDTFLAGEGSTVDGAVVFAEAEELVEEGEGTVGLETVNYQLKTLEGAYDYELSMTLPGDGALTALTLEVFDDGLIQYNLESFKEKVQEGNILTLKWNLKDNTLAGKTIQRLTVTLAGQTYECFEQYPIREVAYVLMNIPYEEFYGGELDDEVSVIDAVSAATRAYTKDPIIAGGTYHEAVEGADILGVIYPVITADADYLKYYFNEVTDEDPVKTIEKGNALLFENPTYSFYRLDQKPACYKVLKIVDQEEHKPVFSKVNVAPVEISGASGEVVLNTDYADVEIRLTGTQGIAENDRVSGVILTTADGGQYGLYHVSNIWRAVNLGGNARRIDLPGKTVTNVRYYTQSSVLDYPVNIHVHDLIKTEAKDPTYEEEGNIDYWTCSICGKLYKDANGKEETTKAAVVIPKLERELSPTPSPTPVPEQTVVPEPVQSPTPTPVPVISATPTPTPTPAPVIDPDDQLKKPGKVTGLKTTAHPHKNLMLVAFKPQLDANEYQVAYKKVGESGWKKLETDGVTRINLQGLEEDACYLIKARALNQNGSKVRYGAFSKVDRRWMKGCSPSFKAGKKSVRIKVAEVPGAVRYQIRYSTSKTMAKAKVVYTRSLTAVLRNLKSNTYYYFRVRPMTKFGGKEYAGALSSVRGVRTK